SGRGVGMDVVRTNIEKIGGKIDLTSTVGAGTNLKIKIPLTLAIIPALTITCGGGRFCIPQVSLLELVRLDPERAEQEVERIQGHPVYRLRGKLLPLVFLNKELGLMDKAGGDTGPINIVVLQADNRQFGLVVDRILDTEEIVVKPLGKQLKGITAYSGATIMGDGKVALILDVMGLAQKARLVADESRDSARGAGAGKDESRAGERKSLLVFTAGGQNNMAVPLSLVTRLEEFKWSTVERSGADDLVQ
ncbi:MAG: chemotaxis protein CheW, partial [Nitrospinaceae bacterium]